MSTERARSLRPRPHHPCTLVAALLLLAAPPALSPAAERAYVLDSAGGSLLAVDVRSGQVLARAAAGGAEELIGLGDGKHLLALSPGAHKSTFCCGFQPKEPIRVTTFDAATLRPGASAEVGWGMPTLRIAAGFEVLSPHAVFLPSLDGRRLSFLCAGYRSKKPEEDRPREMVTIEPESGRVVGRVALDRPLELVGRAGATETAVLFAPAAKGKLPLPAEVVFVDLATQAIAARLTIEGEPARPLLTADGAWLYLLDPGRPSNKKEKNVDGAIRVVSLSERRLAASLPAGSGPRALVWDEARQQALLASDGPPAEKGERRAGQLRVLAAGELAATIEVAEDPHLVRLAGAKAYVAGRDAISIVALDERRAAGQILLDHAEGIDEIVFTPDLGRAFALYGGSSRLSVLDLALPHLVGSVTTGRGGVKFAKALGAAALSVAATTVSYYQGMTVAQTQGQRHFTYNTYNFGIAPVETSVAVRPDGRFAYALNTQTNDVTVVDASAATVVSKEAANGRSLAPLTGGGRFAVLGADELRLFDTGSQLPGLPLAFDHAQAVRLLFNGSGETAVAYGGRTCYLLDGRTGVVRARVDGLQSVTAVLFGEAPEAPSEPSTP